MFALNPNQMTLENQLIVGFYILIAAGLSMIIGLDRERNQKSAGLRTHMLTGVAACLFTILSLYAFPKSDTSRIASNVVTGVGFLGSGIIIQRKRLAHDLTTAVSIWVTAAIGMAIGAGLWLLAIIVTLIVWTILSLVRKLKPNEYEGDYYEEDESTALA